MWTRVCFSLRTFQEGSRAQAAAPASAFSLSFFFLLSEALMQTRLEWLGVSEHCLFFLKKTLRLNHLVPLFFSARRCAQPSLLNILRESHRETKRFQLFKSCRVNTSRVIRSRGSQNDSGVKWDNSFSIARRCRATEPGLQMAERWETYRLRSSVQVQKSQSLLTRLSLSSQ